MPISKRYRCLFIHIPKTGGTSIEAALDIFGDWKFEDQEKLFGQIQSSDIKNLGYLSNYLQHLTYEQCQTITPIDTSFKSFSIVRNPWDRLVSIFSNTDNDLKRVAKLQGIELDNLTFPEFIEATAQIEHIHLEEQYKFIYNVQGELCVDFVGRFEYLATSFNTLCQKILNVELKLPCKNSSTHRAYTEYYSHKEKKIIEARYKKDIQIFNYKF